MQSIIESSPVSSPERSERGEQLRREIQQGNAAGVRELVICGANGNTRGRRGRSALCEAVINWLSYVDQDVADLDLGDEASKRWGIVSMLLDSATA